MDARLLERHLEGVTAAHRGLEAMLEDLLGRGVLDPVAPSLLPDWTVGHVLTHLARNAGSIVRVLEASERGEAVERYPDGDDGRDADIEAGAGRTAEEHVADVRRADEHVEAALAGHTRWDGVSLEPNGRTVTMAELVYARWREVEVHRADLDLGYGPDDWPYELVRTELARLEMQWRARRPTFLTTLPAAALAAPDRRRLAWLLGRADIDGLEPAGVFS